MGPINQLHERNTIDLNLMSIMVGDGSIAKFWDDTWCGGVSLKIQFHKLYALSLMKGGIVCDYWSSTR